MVFKIKVAISDGKQFTRAFPWSSLKKAQGRKEGSGPWASVA